MGLSGLFAIKTLRTYARLALALSLVALSSSAVQAQETDDEILRINTSLVQLNVGVADRAGRAIKDLARNDFVVYEDGVRQSIVSFEPTTAPFSLVILLDMSGSTLNFRQTLRQSALRFVDALSPDDRVAVVAFSVRKNKGKSDRKVDLLTRFTTDRRDIAHAITRADGNGETNLYEGIRFSLEQLSKEGQRRKAVVVITDGKDTELEKLDRVASGSANTNDEALATVNHESAAAVRSVLDAADRLGVTIYPLALPSGDLRRLAEPLPQQVAIYTAARARLQALADRTGGRLHEINRLEDMGRLYAEVAADLRALYSIAYQPDGSRPRNGQWRKIEIHVARPELIARARPGYFAR